MADILPYYRNGVTEAEEGCVVKITQLFGVRAAAGMAPLDSQPNALCFLCTEGHGAGGCRSSFVCEPKDCTAVSLR